MEGLNANRYLVILALAAIVAAGIAVRGWHLDRECAYWDEVASLQHLDAPNLGAFLRLERRDDPPMVPAYFALEYCWAALSGGSVVAMRLLSLALATANILLMYLLASTLYDAVAGLVAALGFALSVTHVYYALEIRPYSLVMFLALISGYSLWRALQEERAHWRALNIAANILLMWTHLFTVFFLFAQGVYLLARCVRRKTPGRLVRWALWQAPSAALLLWWVMRLDMPKLEVAAAWREKLVHSYLMPLGDFLLFAGAGVPTFRDVAAFGGWNMGGILWRVSLPILLFSGVMTFRCWRMTRLDEQPRARKSVEAFWFLFPWLVLPTIALFLVSSQVYACHSSRYVMYGGIPFLALVGAAVSFTPGRIPRFLAVLFLAGLYGYNLYAHPGPWRHDFRHANVFLHSEMGPHESLVVYHLADVTPMRFNWAWEGFPGDVRGAVSLQEAREFCTRPLESGDAPRLWLVLLLHENPEPEIRALESALHAHAKSVLKWQFGYVRPILLYRIDR